jgi:hypothetical protein
MITIRFSMHLINPKNPYPMRFFRSFLILFLFVSSLSGIRAQTSIDLSGEWGFQFDPSDFERSFENSGAHRDPLSDHILLPGTTDSNHKGLKTSASPINRLSRIYEYSGVAWYQKDVEIPANWGKKSIELFLERVLWISSVYVDGQKAGTVSGFSTPHSYDLTHMLSPGRHRISVCIDNRVPESFDRWSHAFSEYTQTAWNGIVGKIELLASDRVHISDLQVYPDVVSKTARVVFRIANPDREPLSGKLSVSAETLESVSASAVVSVPFSGSDSLIQAEMNLPMSKDVSLWDEFNPALYSINAALEGFALGNHYSDKRSVMFGMRNYGHDGHHFTINGKPVFLRGTLECAVFPLTGYPDMSVDGWMRICRIVKSYGMNHIRFHSWCPPEAAFEAADRCGIYLQVELPAWTDMGKDPMLNRFFKQELDRILTTYGNHPSFVQLCVGNELRGDFSYMAGLIAGAEKQDPRHLYSGSTARKHLPEDQFYVSHVSTAGMITTYGARGPMTDYDLRKEYEVLNVPGVAHEVGQRAVYPDFDEIKKYTGVLYPRNFEVFRDTLRAHGMLDQAKDFCRVSGQMTAFLYKESIEALLRTPNCGGFQLLDLHDFPGQGTALVGLLDPFWDSKGIISPEKFREFCSPTVPILRLTKRTFTADETLMATAELYHYGSQDLKGLQASWDIRTTDNQRIASGKFPTTDVAVGSLHPLGVIKASLSRMTQARKLVISVYAGSEIRNSWEIWVYPAKLREEKSDAYLIAERLDAPTVAALNAGKSVLLLPDITQLEGKQADFQNHFWCPIMFRWEPMTMGALVQSQHPAFGSFPTEFYTNWQWWDIISHAKTLGFEGTPDKFRPLLQVIDTYDRCLKEGIIFETRVGKGKLLMASIDFRKDMDQRPAARQLLYSLKKYIASPEFKPIDSIPLPFLQSKFREPTLLTGARVVLSDSYETGNEADMAIDGDVNTIWHTAYGSPGNFAVTNRQPETDYPHEIQIELAKESVFKGFTYFPRTDGTNGRIFRYEMYVSNDCKTWGTAVSKGEFTKGDKPCTVLFEAPQKARYVRFVALAAFDGQKWASIAEIALIPLK